MKHDDELILKALDRDMGAQSASSLDQEELRALRAITTGLSSMEAAAPPPGFTDRVMAALPERRQGFWARLRELLVRPHIVKLNLAWESAAAVCLLALALGNWGNAPGLAPTATQTAGATPSTIHTRFIIKAPGAKEVSLAGDFNNWRQDVCRLIKAEAEGVWTVTVPLEPGRYKYMFFVDGQQWQTDPLAESYEQDGFGHRNAVVDVQAPEQASV